MLKPLKHGDYYTELRPLAKSKIFSCFLGIIIAKDSKVFLSSPKINQSARGLHGLWVVSSVFFEMPTGPSVPDLSKP